LVEAHNGTGGNIHRLSLGKFRLQMTASDPNGGAALGRSPAMWGISILFFFFKNLS